ncbi:MAG: T9SS type A sorting domain-containing protein [Crocinitomicaceae bacterium]
MKTKITLLISIFVLITSVAKAQTTFYGDSVQASVCDTTYYMNIAPLQADWSGFTYGRFVINGMVMNHNFDLDVNWGDGTTTNHTGTAVLGGVAIAWNNSLQHTYTVGGIHTITMTLTDLTTAAVYTVSQDINMGACPQYIYSFGSVDCNNDGVTDATINSVIPMNLVSGNLTYPGIPYTSFTFVSSVSAGNYQAVVDPAWLASNGYLVSSITPDSITTGFYSGSFTFQINLICDTSNFVSNCLDGTAFCDGNNNGVFDTLETIIPNLPVTLYLPDGSFYMDTTDANGNYSYNYQGNPSGGFISIDQNWLYTNGYFPSNQFNDTISDLTCNNNPIINIPVICDTNALSVGCIDGYVYCDDNGNGIFDSTETAFYNAPVTLQGLGGLITVYTDSNGFYSYSGWQLSGNNVFVSVDQSWQTANAAYVSANGVFLSNLDCANNNQTNLALTCTSAITCADLWTTVTPWNGYYQNFTNSVRLKYGNFGSSAPGNYTVTLDFPTGVTPVTTSINNSNYTITGNTITWTLNSTSNSMFFSDVIYFNTPTGIPDSTFHIFSSSISSATNDCDSSNNYSTLGMYVGNSYDPNDKSVNKPLIVDPSIQDEYTYVIRFQNTGTAPAQDVYILDTLTTNLDWSTFELIEASHSMQLIDLGNGLIKFDFPQIWLPDSTTNEPLSHGNIVFKIKELASLGEGDIVENTAYIYFDQNPAIITNTTKNINTVGLGINTVGTIDFNVYPNPANSIINIQSEGVIESLRVVDMSGKIVFESNGHSNIETINIEALSSGLYNIEIKSNNGIGRSLFIKQ